jgi:hypothetical protein
MPKFVSISYIFTIPSQDTGVVQWNYTPHGLKVNFYLHRFHGLNLRYLCHLWIVLKNQSNSRLYRNHDKADELFIDNAY